MNLTRIAVNRPVTTAMVSIAIILLGLFSVGRLPIDLVPDISFPSLTVSTTYSGVAPEEMESLVTIPIEQALSTVPGVTGMESVSQEGSSRVTLRFAWGTDLETAANEVRANLDRVRSRLPSDASAPRVFRFDPSQFPIMTLGVAGDLEPADLRRLAEDEILYYLERLEGVASVTVQGGGVREVQVRLDPLRLQAHGITLDQVVQALRAENMNAPAGRIALGEAQFSLRTLGRLTSVDQLPGVVVTNRDGVPTYLGELADIRSTADDEGVRVRVDGRPGVVLSVQKQPGSNTVAVADAVLKAVEELNARFPELSIRPLSDTSGFIRAAVRNVLNAGLMGGVLACLILLFFLQSIRATLIIATVLPISLIASFILIERAGMTLNVMSLGGLALGVGMLLDNSIVVLENVYRHQLEGRGPVEAAIDGAGEMASAVIASTLTTLAVFLPLMFVTGTSGVLFRQLSLMVAFSIGCSLLVALTVLPALCSRVLKVDSAGDAGTGGHVAKGADGARGSGIGRRIAASLARLEAVYRSSLQWALRRPGLVVGGAVVLFALSLPLVPLLGTELMPAGDEGEIGISIALPPGTRLEVTDAVALRVEELVRERVPELKALDSRVGAGFFGGRGTHSATVNVTLVSQRQRERSTAEVVADLREAIEQLPGVNARVTARSSFVQRLASGSVGGGGGDRISLEVKGYDLGLLREVADDLQELIAGIPGISSVAVARDEAQPEFVLRVDRERAADFGLTTSQVASAVQAAVQGRVATTLTLNGQDFDVRALIARDDAGEGDRLSPADVEALPIPVGGGSYVTLGTVASLSQEDSPAAIERSDRQRRVRLTASPEGRDLGGAVQRIREAVDAYGLPEGVSLHFGGEYEEQQRAFREMTVVLLLAVSLVYLVMASQFESLLDPLIVMFSVPFALVGVIWTLALTGTPVTTQAFMGLIMLGGVVVNNAIVLVTYIGLLRERGLTLDEAVVRGASTRLRPIFMMTGTTVLALVPLALEFGEGAEIQAPLARVVIGGLLVSSFVTLILIPVLYRTIHHWRERRAEGAARVDAVPAAVKSASIAVLLAVAGAAMALVAPVAFAAQEPVRGTAAEEPSSAAVTVTLDEAVARALARHARVRDAEAAVELARSQLRLAEASYRPRLTVDGDWGVLRPTGEPGAESAGGTLVSVSARQVLPTGTALGRIALPVALARMDVEIAEWERRNAAETAALDVLSAYVNVLKAERALEVSRESLRRAEDALAEVELKLNLGMASELDHHEVLARRAAAEAAVFAAEQRAEAARARLAQALDLPAGLTVQVEEPAVPDGFFRADDGSLSSGSPPETALEAHGEWVRVRDRLRRAELEAEARVSGTAAVLQLSAGLQGPAGSVSLGWESGSRDTSLTVSKPVAQHRYGGTGGDDRWSPPGGRPGFPSSRSRWRVDVSVSWPLYDGGGERERRLQEDVRTAQLEDELQRLTRSVALEVREAETAALEAAAQLTIAEMELEVARGRQERVRRRVEAGVDTLGDLLDAQLAVLQAERRFHEARWDYVTATARHRKVLGLPVWPFRADEAASGAG